MFNYLLEIPNPTIRVDWVLNPEEISDYSRFRNKNFKLTTRMSRKLIEERKSLKFIKRVNRHHDSFIKAMLKCLIIKKY